MVRAERARAALTDAARRVADELRRLAALRSYHGPLVGLRDVDERGVLVSWCPERA